MLSITIIILSYYNTDKYNCNDKKIRLTVILRILRMIIITIIISSSLILMFIGLTMITAIIRITLMVMKIRIVNDNNIKAKFNTNDSRDNYTNNN